MTDVYKRQVKSRGRNIYGKVCRDMVEVHDEQQQVSLKFAQECILPVSYTHLVYSINAAWII